MSAADQHRADAERFQHWAASASSDQAAAGHAARGVLSALLAIEARLGELVDAQHTATDLARSAYGMTDPDAVQQLAPDAVQQLVNAVGDAVTGTPPGGYRDES